MSATAADGAVYWLRWQVFVCAAFIVLPAAAAAALLPRLRRSAAPLRATDLWVPCWTRLHPGWLLGYRAFALAAAAALIVRLLVTHGPAVFYFYTQWTFLLVTIYFVFATAISAHGCWVFSKRSTRKADLSHEFLTDDIENRDISNSISGEEKRDRTNMTASYYEQKSWILGTLHANCLPGICSILTFAGKLSCSISSPYPNVTWGKFLEPISWDYAAATIISSFCRFDVVTCDSSVHTNTSAGATMLTDVTFWGLLVPFFYRDRLGLTLVTDGMHTLNAVFLLIDTILNNMPFPWYRMAFFVFWSCSYIIFQWLLHACGGLSWWPYPFLDLASSGAPLWYFGMAIAHVPCFFLYWYIVKAKRTYFPRLFPHAYVRTS